MIELGGKELAPCDIDQIVFKRFPIGIFGPARQRLLKTYAAIVLAAKGDEPVYGVNTGFGALAEVKIRSEHQEDLQRNIILSHAVGVGEPLSTAVAKTLMLFRLNSLVQGYSGASLDLIEHLVALINHNCCPYIPKKGSVGASGDLAPLAHLGLLLLGIGQAFVDDRLVTAEEALRTAKLKPLKLGMRDGLALINGTQAMAAVAAVSLKEIAHWSNIADITAAVTIEAVGGQLAAFDDRISQLKPHQGQITTAANMRRILRGRPIKPRDNFLTQDPYSIRCIPQVHGSTRDITAHVHDLVYREINSVTDNPLIFFREDNRFDILSGGNFHGQHIAAALDYLAMGLQNLANIAERRLELLLNPEKSNGLPAFLVNNGGVNSGYMMLHVTATALVSENKILCHPASIDSIPTSAGREDHVSMGMNAANKLVEILNNTKTVLAIEMLAAFQGLDLLRGSQACQNVKSLERSFREIVAFRHEDGLYREDLDKTLQWLTSSKTKKLIEDILNNDEKE